MRRLIALALVAAAVAPLLAQDPNQTDLASQSPQTNARGGSVRNRAPGTWVQSALTRHSALIGQRVNAVRTGADSSDETTTNSTGSQSTSGSSFDALLSVANQFLAGGGSLSSLSGLGDMTGLLGTLTGGTTSTSTSGTGSMSIADLLQLRDALAAQEGTSKLSSQQQTLDSTTGSLTSTKTSATAATSDTTTQFGGAIARLPKAAQLYQTSTSTATTDRKLKDRIAEAWSTTFFAAITVAFQTRDFITVLENAFRPLVYRTSTGSTDSSTDSNSSTDSGIQDLTPSDNSGNSGSTL